jgi:hypothetical protein
MNWPEPISISASFMAPPSNFSPSMLGDRHGLAVARRDGFQRLGDGVVLGLAGQFLQADALEVRDGDFRQHFQRHGEGQVLPVLELQVLDLRLLGRLQLVVGDDFPRGLVHGAFQDLAHHGLAVPLLDERNGHLARAETRDFQGLGQFRQARVAARGQVRGGHHHLVGALQAIGRGLGNLHSTLSLCC